ncbi:MAG: hypothetical protein IJB31_09225, partial [Akkermansia sp.]|nr:hypothetical protein [Akkermansia sp.]
MSQRKAPPWEEVHIRAGDGILPAHQALPVGQGSLAKVFARLGGKMLAYSHLAHSWWVRIPDKRNAPPGKEVHLSAGVGIRTHDINLGKVALYH